jgi:pimeloyl-ACP methyl ester carboxylesterase
MVIYSGTPAPSVTILGVRCFVAGDGPPIVLLHANGGDHHDYDAVSSRLVRHGHCVIGVDWPGHGAEADGGRYRAVDYADLLPELLDGLKSELGIDGRVVLIGNSVGGFAAVRAAVTRPDRVEKVILVNPGGFTPRWPTTRLVCQLFGRERCAPIVMRWLPRLYLRIGNEATKRLCDEARARSHDPARVRTFAAMWRSFAEPTHRAVGPGDHVGCPVLLMWGARDPVLPWLIDGRRARRAIPNAHIVRLKCGHQAFAELPDAFVDAATTFLGTTTSAT